MCSVVEGTSVLSGSGPSATPPHTGRPQGMAPTGKPLLRRLTVPGDCLRPVSSTTGTEKGPSGKSLDRQCLWGRQDQESTHCKLGRRIMPLEQPLTEKTDPMTQHLHAQVGGSVDNG